MKLFLLPVLYWTLAISPIFAQKQIPVSVQPYLLHQDKSTLRLLDIAGFKFDDLMTERISPRSPELTIDSTVTFNSYHGTDSLPLALERYSYPEANVQVVHEFNFDVEHWSLYSRTTSITDELGRNTDIIAQLYNEELQTYVPDSRLQIFPHGQSTDLIDSFIVSVWSVEENKWFRQLATYNTFDENDRISESLSSIEFFEIPILFLDRYRYNSEGLLVQIDSYNLDGGLEFPAGRKEMAYENNLLKWVTSYISDGLDGYLPDSKTEYRYTASGQWELVQTFTFDFEKNDWKLINVEGYVYDNENRVEAVEYVTLDDTGLWIRNKTGYAYEQDEYVSVESTYTYDNNVEDWIINERKYYYYQDETTGTDDPIEADATFLYPNPSPGQVQLKLTGKISVHIYTLEGKLVKNFYMPPGEKTLDLSSFPAGVYQVMAKSDEDYYSGKLVIQ